MSRRGEALVLLAALGAQAVVVMQSRLPVSAVAAVAGALLCLSVGVETRRLVRISSGFAVLLTPVLVLRLVSFPSWSTVQMWAAYGARLIAAASLAVAYIQLRGSRGISRALDFGLGWIPAGVGTMMSDIVVSTLHMIPLARRRARDAWEAASVRLAVGRDRGRIIQISLAVRATVVSVSSIPRSRAEAMVVRGLVERDQEP